MKKIPFSLPHIGQRDVTWRQEADCTRSLREEPGISSVPCRAVQRQGEGDSHQHGQPTSSGMCNVIIQWSYNMWTP